MRLTRPLLPASILVLVLVLAGCSRTKAPYDVTADPYLPTQVQIADKSLANRLAFQPPRAARDDAGLLYITVPVRAATNRRQIRPSEVRICRRLAQQWWGRARIERFRH